jgi:hypothetical protein
MLGENLGRRRAPGQRLLLATTCAWHTRSSLLCQHQKCILKKNAVIRHHHHGSCAWSKSYPQSHPIFTLSLELVSPHIPSFQWYLQSRKILLDISMKCWNWAFHAQDSRVIIVVVQIGAVKIYVATMEALKKNERQDETQFITKIGGKN